MALFFNYTRPGPGVSPDAPRKTGFPRIVEMIGRDFKTFWAAGMISLLLLLPFAAGVTIACMTGGLLIALLAGCLGGVIAAPGVYGLADTLLLSLRDVPGFWWHRYRRIMEENWKSTLLPGALAGTVFSVQFFILVHLPVLDGGLLLLVCQLVSMVVSIGLFVWGLPQQALLNLSFAALLKNSLFLFVRYFIKTFFAVMCVLLYALLLWLLFPGSVFLLMLVGLWLPMLLMLQQVYPTLDAVFHIEESITNLRNKE